MRYPCGIALVYGVHTGLEYELASGPYLDPGGRVCVDVIYPKTLAAFESVPIEMFRPVTARARALLRVRPEER